MRNGLLYSTKKFFILFRSLSFQACTSSHLFRPQFLTLLNNLFGSTEKMYFCGCIQTSFCPQYREKYTDVDEISKTKLVLIIVVASSYGQDPNSSGLGIRIKDGENGFEKEKKLKFLLQESWTGCSLEASTCTLKSFMEVHEEVYIIFVYQK